MKSLVEFIKEKKECENCEKSYASKSFSFNFKDFENSKETLEALASAAGENISYTEDDGKISFTISKENYSEATAFLTALKDYVKKLGNTTTKRASDAAYADKVSKMESKINELDSLIASYSTEEKSEDADKDKKEDE